LFAALSDVSIASDRAIFRAVELLRGLPDMWLAAVLPAHIGVGRTRDLGMTGRSIDATEAHQIGLVTRIADHAELESQAEAAAHQLMEAAPQARNAWRREIGARYGPIDEMTMEAALEGEEVAEGFRSFLEKRPPAWTPPSSAGN
jgi:enoyl-CoA hydratase